MINNSVYCVLDIHQLEQNLNTTKIIIKKTKRLKLTDQ